MRVKECNTIEEWNIDKLKDEDVNNDFQDMVRELTDVMAEWMIEDTFDQ